MNPGLRPYHTRQGFSSGGRLQIERELTSPGDFLLSGNGLWLLPCVLAERELRAGEAKLAALAQTQKLEGMRRHASKTKKAAIILGNSAINSAGCWVDGLPNGDSPGSWALYFGEQEWGSFALTTPEEMPHIQACDTEDCYNARHYSIDFGRLTLKERKIDLNPNFYNEQPDGSILTIWGDRLPSVRDSLAHFIEFQRLNYPFVPVAESRLTAGAISQIGFHPVSGCWEAWQYYCNTKDTDSNWQYDGYGRLYQREPVAHVDEQTGEVKYSLRAGHAMAHRVVWHASGRTLIPGQVLNHLCSYRRCCNPLHLRQETKSQNNSHGVVVQRAVRQLEETLPGSTSHRLNAAEQATRQKEILELYQELAA